MAQTFVQMQPVKLSGSGITATATSVGVESFKDPQGNNVVTADIGDGCYATLEPNTSREEIIEITAITQNADGTATLTVTRNLDYTTPYTQISATGFAHAGGTLLVVSNNPQVYNDMSSNANDETITGTWTFDADAYPKVDDSSKSPTDDAEFATKKYADDLAIAGSPDATNSVKGLVEIATIAEASSGAAAGSGDTTADLAITAALCSNTSSAAQLIPVTDADGDIPVEFMELDATWAFTSTVNIATAGNWQLGGTAFTGTMALLNEACTFFNATDISGAEAETLTDGSDADSLHNHTITANFGSASQAINTTGTQDITHSLGATPAVIHITIMAVLDTSGDTIFGISRGSAKPGITQTCVNTTNQAGTSDSVTVSTDDTAIAFHSGYIDVRVTTIDSTKFTLTWDTNANTGAARQIHWEAIANTTG